MESIESCSISNNKGTNHTRIVRSTSPETKILIKRFQDKAADLNSSDHQIPQTIIKP